MKKEPKTYPQFKCHHCQELIDLKFDPRDNNLLALRKLICPKCGKRAYKK